MLKNNEDEGEVIVKKCRWLEMTKIVLMVFSFFIVIMSNYYQSENPVKIIFLKVPWKFPRGFLRIYIFIGWA